MGDLSVESLFPEGWERFELGSSGWSRVLGVDAVGGSPYCDFADEGGVRVVSRCRPNWRAISLAGVVLDLVGEVGDQLGSLRQVAAPDRIGMQRWWNARQPGQRTWIGWRERETPVEDSGHIVCGSKVAPGGGGQHVTEGVFTGFGGEGEQVGPQR